MERLQLTHHPNKVDDGCGHEHHEHATQPDQSTHMASIGCWGRCLIFDIRHRLVGFHADQLSLLLLLLLLLRAFASPSCQAGCSFRTERSATSC